MKRSSSSFDPLQMALQSERAAPKRPRIGNPAPAATSAPATHATAVAPSATDPAVSQLQKQVASIAALVIAPRIRNIANELYAYTKGNVNKAAIREAQQRAASSAQTPTFSNPGSER